jgi:hypothetical protein
MRFLAIALLCFVGQRFAMEFEPFGLIHLNSHFGGYTNTSNAPDEKQPEYMDHHPLSEMILSGIGTTSSPIAITSSLWVLDELYCEGPVFAIDHPPQLS